jgi:vacuolar-type H+-ATPase subunit I/STV1
MSSDGSSCCCGGSCGCGGHEDESERVYLTREEYIQRLEKYLEDLKAEIEAVNKELAELRQAA